MLVLAAIQQKTCIGIVQAMKKTILDQKDLGTSAKGTLRWKNHAEIQYLSSEAYPMD